MATARSFARRAPVGGVLLIALVTVLGGCGWPQPGFDASRSSNNPFENVLGPANIATVTPSWSAGSGLVGGAPVIQGGRMISASLGGVRAFDTATGAPLWKSPIGDPPVGIGYRVLGTGSISGTGDVVYIGAGNSIGSRPPRSGTVGAYDARTGSVVWSKDLGTTRSVASLIDGRGFVLVNRAVGDASDFTGLVAFDPASGLVLFRVALANGLTIAAVPGTVFVSGSSRVDAIPTAGCGAPVCVPTWHGDITQYDRTVVIAADGLAYVGNGLGLSVFAAAGCGASTCLPRWTAAGDFAGGLAIGGGRLYASPDWIHPQAPPPRLRTFAAAGCGAPTCTPLWQSAESREFGPPTIANGVVYTTTHAGPTQAWPAAGCGAAQCAPLWTSGQVVQGTGIPVVADGRLYTGEATVETFVLVQ